MQVQLRTARDTDPR